MFYGPIMADNTSPIEETISTGLVNPPLRKRQIVPAPKVVPSAGRLRKRRVNFRKADVARAISAAAKVGLVATSVEISPDGLIRIISASGKPSGDLFDEWSDRL